MAKCQKEMLEQASKLQDTALKVVVKAKKKAIKELTIDDAAALEAALAAVLASNHKIVAKGDQLVGKVDRKCAAVQALPSAVFPGVCAAPTLLEIEDCVIAAARCQACVMISAFDALGLDCDPLDDQLDNGSCPLP